MSMRSNKNILAAAVCVPLLALAGIATVATADHHRDGDRPRGVSDSTAPNPTTQTTQTRERRTMTKHADELATLKGMRVAVLTGEGLHDMETLAPIAFLSNRGAKVTVIGIEPRMVTAYNSNIQVLIQKSVADVSVDDFDALVLPGGRAPDRIRQHSEVVQFAGDFFRTGKPVAAICHGPQILVTAGVLDGFTATCIASISDEISSSGAKYKDKEVVVDRNLITSRLPDDIPAFVAAIERTMIKAHRGETLSARPGS